jgi:hypothetical protein
MASGLTSFLFGSSPTTKQVPLFSPEQQQARQGLRTSAQQQLQNNPLSFAPIKQQYEQQFRSQVIPTLAERFSGNLSSSAFKGALGNTASDFYSKLAGLESQYNLGANKQALSQLQLGLSPEFQNLNIPGKTGFLENIANQLGQAGVNYFSGGLSNLLGGRGFHGQEQDPLEALKSIFGSLNLPESKIQQIMNILGAA